jgi:EmrB/QacA subfamily drug resistance transporter
MNQKEGINEGPATISPEQEDGHHHLRDVAHILSHIPGIFHLHPPDGDGREHANKWAVLILAASGGFMTTLDSSIVNIGLPAIARTFGVGVSGAIEWIIIGYLLVIASVLLTFGRLADMIGRKPIYLAGLVIFVLGSVFSGAAPSLTLLILARIFQGLGGALIFSVNIAMVTSVFPARERGRALGLNSVVVALGISLGPTIGGVITQYFTWRWIFYVNVPVGIVVLVASMRILTERMHKGRGHFDLPGAALFALGLASFTLGLSFGQEWGWSSPAVIGAIVIGVVALICAVLVERKVPDPILSIKLLKNRVFASANISFMLAMLALFAPGFLLPFYFEELRGFSVVQAGLLLTPLPVTLAIMAPLSGTLADRIGSSWLSPLGLAISCLGLFFLSQIDAHSTIPDILWRLVLTGIGQGLFQAPNTRALMGAARPSEQGIASGVLATGRVIGQSLSVAIGGTIFTSFGAAAAGTLLATQGQHLPASRVNELQQTFVSGFHAALLICAAFAAIGIFTALVRGNEAKRKTTIPPGVARTAAS